MDTLAYYAEANSGLIKTEEQFLGLNLYGKFKEHLKLRAQRRADRKAFRHIVSLEPGMLKDLGITRDDVYWAERLPLTFSASLELQKIARKV